MEITKQRISFAFDPRDMLLSLQISSLRSESSCLPPCILLLLLLYTASSSNLSSHHRDREHLLRPTAFSAMFFPKCLTGGFSHCCIFGGKHCVDVHVPITRTDEWCEFLTYCCLESACHIWVPPILKVKP